jgi:hypothetical protein
MRNDLRYGLDPDHRADNRWLHRPAMDWVAADRRHLPRLVEARVFGGIVKILRARARTPHLHAQTPSEVLDLGTRACSRSSAATRWVRCWRCTTSATTPRRSTRPCSTRSACASPTTSSRGASSTSAAALALRPYERLWLT